MDQQKYEEAACLYRTDRPLEPSPQGGISLGPSCPAPVPFLTGTTRLIVDAGCRKMAGEDAADAEFAGHLEAGLVPLKDMLDDGETQTRTAFRAISPLVDPVEPFRQAGYGLARYANSGVRDREVPACVVLAPSTTRIPSREGRPTFRTGLRFLRRMTVKRVHPFVSAKPGPVRPPARLLQALPMPRAATA